MTNGELLQLPPLRVALVGTGKIARNAHLPSYRELGDRVRVVALCDTNPEAAKALAARFNVPRTYRDYPEMLRVEHPDIVNITTPSILHKEMAIQAAEAGCNIFVEKPMAHTLEDCDEMTRTAEKAGVRLCVNHNQIFHRPLLKALERIERGEVGDIVSVHISYILKRAAYMTKGHWTGNNAAGVVLETFPHPIYIAMALVGNVKRVQASARKRTDLEWMDLDDFNVALEGEKACATIYLGHKTSHWRYWVDILGTERSLTVDMLNSWVLDNRMADERILSKNMASLRNAATLLGNTFNEGLRISPKYWLNSHQTIIRRFVDAIEHGGAVPYPGAKAREVMRVVIETADQIRKSAQPP